MPSLIYNQTRQTAYSKGGGRPIYPYIPKDQEEDTVIGVMLPFNGSSIEKDDTDLGSATYLAVSGSIESNEKSERQLGKFPVSYTTTEQALTNLKNLLLTYPGERMLQPTFGVRIKDRVFEPNSPELIVNLNREIQDAIKYWLPYIKIQNINIDNRDENKNLTNTLFIKLTFRVTDQGANQIITIMTDGNTTTSY
jgi:hypothetical protein